MIRALGLALALAIALAATAQAGILAPEDAAELAQSLAEAQEEQGVCYAWSIANNFSDTPDVGSSTAGPDRPLPGTSSEGLRLPETCTKGIVQLEGKIDYACDSCEAEDSASVSITSNLPNPPTVADLEELGLKADALTGDKDDTTLLNMVNALPLLVADRGIAPYVPYEPAATVPATDHATGKPASDFLRESGVWLVVFAAVLLVGPGFYLYKRWQ